jgi:hypothetical protein
MSFISFTRHEAFLPPRQLRRWKPRVANDDLWEEAIESSLSYAKVS